MDLLQNTFTSRDTSRTKRIFTTFTGAPPTFDEDGKQYAVTTLDTKMSFVALCYYYLKSNQTDNFIFNGEARLISYACLLKALTWGKKGKITAVDMVLRIPSSPYAKGLAWIRKRLWAQVDLFIHYFSNLAGYDKYYCIDAEKSTYVPFKSNIYLEASILTPDEIPKGDYVFSAGRSLRDYATLIEAARISGLPTAILCTSLSDWESHGTRVDLSALPDNVRLIQDNGGKSGWIEGLKHARVVAIPTLPSSICASGIGTYLDAMALGKPVIITKGPGADDILTEDIARFVNPCSPEAMAAEMKRLWDNAERANSLAAGGRLYALSLGDNQALVERVLAEAAHN